jgi:hypothetical protein
MDAILTTLFRYAPVWKCIYCGSDGGIEGLTDEHVVPLSLGGMWLLPEASCTACSKITSYVEGYCARKIFHEFRLSDQLPTRRKKERPKTLEYRLNFGDRIETYDSPIEEHPSTVALPHLPMPGLLLEFSKNVGWKKLSLISWTKRTNIWHNPPIGTVSLKVKLDMNVLVFARMLAKIAHSYIAGEFGIDTFRPMLQDLILGNDKNAAFVVGSEPHLSPPTELKSNTLHWDRWDGHGKSFLSARIRLFTHLGWGVEAPANIGSPIYHVVVGEIDPSKPMSPLKTSITLS